MMAAGRARLPISSSALRPDSAGDWSGGAACGASLQHAPIDRLAEAAASRYYAPAGHLDPRHGRRPRDQLRHAVRPLPVEGPDPGRARADRARGAAPTDAAGAGGCRPRAGRPAGSAGARPGPGAHRLPAARPGRQPGAARPDPGAGRAVARAARAAAGPGAAGAAPRRPARRLHRRRHHAPRKGDPDHAAPRHPSERGLLRALRFGDGPRIVLAAHGITASAMSFRAVARHLPARWSLVALDLRGRGGSAGMPGPYGMSAHAADIVAAAEHLGSPLVLSGQSMGAYAALRAAVLRPELFTRLVLIDGGLPLPVPAGADPDQLLELTLGPALARLRQSFPDVEAYLDLFKAHPALAGDWNDDVAEYVRYDATGEPGAIRSRVNGEAVYADGRDLLVNAASFGDDLLTLAVPTVLLYAPRGMFGEEPGLLPQSIVDLWVARAPALRAELVEGTNHYTILMTDRAAKLIATRLTE